MGFLGPLFEKRGLKITFKPGSKIDRPSFKRRSSKYMLGPEKPVLNWKLLPQEGKTRSSS
jgi:hypothetical protein